MNKKILFGGVLLSMLAFTSCDDSFDDWAQPMSNDPEAAAEAYGLTFSGSGIDIDMNAENVPDSFKLVSVTSSNAAIKSIKVKEIRLNGAVIKATEKADGFYVATADVDEIAKTTLKSQKYEKRALPVDVDAVATLTSGEAVAVSGQVTQNETPIKTPDVDANGYYLLGNLNDNNWDVTRPMMMNKVGDGVYRLTVTTTGDSNWFKFYGASHQGSWDEANQAQLGCKVNGDAATFGYIEWNDVQTPVIAGAGTWVVTLDVNNWTYSITTPVLYMAGEANSWTQTEPLGSANGTSYTGFMYLSGAFKFCTQKDWDGTNYGAGFSTAGDAANMSLPDGYEAGYYKVDLNLDAKSMTLTAITTIGLIGDCTPGGWNDSTPMTYNAETKAWEIKDVTLKDGELKFRANDGWDINWGGDDLSSLKQGGANLKVTAGTYDIQLFAWADGYAYAVMTRK